MDVADKRQLPRRYLVQGSDGNLYGSTNRGGANDLGTLFKTSPSGVLVTLAEFTGDGPNNKGASPFAGLVQVRVATVAFTERQTTAVHLTREPFSRLPPRAQWYHYGSLLTTR